jgi:hypothetical protein
VGREGKGVQKVWFPEGSTMRPRRQSRITLLQVLTLVLVVGCGDNSGRQRISGEVTFQGRPVDQGSIEFLPGPGVASHAGAVIENGRYTIPADKGLLPGLYAIKISWPERQGRPNEVPGVPAGSRDLIPSKYNSKTTLTREVQQGANVIDFHLE